MNNNQTHEHGMRGTEEENLAGVPLDFRSTADTGGTRVVQWWYKGDAWAAFYKGAW